MADPVTIMLVAATAMKAVGTLQQGQADKAMADARANAEDFNAGIKRQEADITRQQTNIREEQQRRQARTILGKQRAFIAQSGAGLGGSMAKITEQSETMAELDSLTIRYEGDLKARGLLASAEMDQYSAKVNRAAGKNAVKASYISAGADILSGSAMAYKSYTMAGTGSTGLKTMTTPSGTPMQGGFSYQSSNLA